MDRREDGGMERWRAEKPIAGRGDVPRTNSMTRVGNPVLLEFLFHGAPREALRNVGRGREEPEMEGRRKD